MSLSNFESELEDLSSAEDFLNYFGVEFDQSVLHVNRLHIMQRFHDYLEEEDIHNSETKSDKEYAEVYKLLLSKAYGDFINSNAQTEKVFKVFKRQEPQTTFVSVEELLGS